VARFSALVRREDPRVRLPSPCPPPLPSPAPSLPSFLRRRWTTQRQRRRRGRRECNACVYRRAGVEGAHRRVGGRLGRARRTRGAQGRKGRPGISPGRFGARGASSAGAGHRGLIPRGRARWAKMERAQWSRDHQTNNTGLPCRGARRKTATSRPTDRPYVRPTDRPLSLLFYLFFFLFFFSCRRPTSTPDVTRGGPEHCTCHRRTPSPSHPLHVAVPRPRGTIAGFRDPGIPEGLGTGSLPLPVPERRALHWRDTKSKREREK